jgi:hypothetical protein
MNLSLAHAPVAWDPRISAAKAKLLSHKLSPSLIIQHQPNKHIELHMHFIIKLIHDQVIEVLFFPTKDQVVDIFTKSLTEAKFSKL